MQIYKFLKFALDDLWWPLPIFHFRHAQNTFLTLRVLNYIFCKFAIDDLSGHWPIFHFQHAQNTSPDPRIVNLHFFIFCTWWPMVTLIYFSLPVCPEYISTDLGCKFTLFHILYLMTFGNLDLFFTSCMPKMHFDHRGLQIYTFSKFALDDLWWPWSPPPPRFKFSMWHFDYYHLILL